MFFTKFLYLAFGFVFVLASVSAGYAITYGTNAFGYSDATSYVTVDLTTHVDGYTDYPYNSNNYYGYNYYSNNSYNYNYYPNYNPNYSAYYYSGSYYYYPRPTNYYVAPVVYPTYAYTTYVTPVTYAYNYYPNGWYYN